MDFLREKYISREKMDFRRTLLLLNFPRERGATIIIKMVSNMVMVMMLATFDKMMF